MNTKPKKRTIEDEIDHVLAQLPTMKVDSDEYRKTILNLDILCKTRNLNNERRVKPDTIAMIVGGIIQMALMLNYEQLHVISTKAVALLWKGRF